MAFSLLLVRAACDDEHEGGGEHREGPVGDFAELQWRERIVQCALMWASERGNRRERGERGDGGMRLRACERASERTRERGGRVMVLWDERGSCLE